MHAQDDCSRMHVRILYDIYLKVRPALILMQLHVAIHGVKMNNFLGFGSHAHLMSQKIRISLNIK